MYPYTRLRRTRSNSWIRDLLAEVDISAKDLILPIFVAEGENVRDEIKSLPEVFRLSIDNVEKLAKEAHEAGIKAIALFPCIPPDLKDEKASEAYNQENLICRAVRHINHLNLDLGIICDVALDPYTNHGHDGIIKDGIVDNDLTIEALKDQALVLAKAGASMLAPSDMMDGRILAIREMLEVEGFYNMPIISYSAKYASNFYGPFRDAVGSNGLKIIADKRTYQLDPRNIKEAQREIALDIEEGADIILIKPALPYLDVIKEASISHNLPIFAYQVSGEYAMLKYASKEGCIKFDDALLESLICIKRAGANSIFTYGALEAAKIIQKRV